MLDCTNLFWLRFWIGILFFFQIIFQPSLLEVGSVLKNVFLDMAISLQVFPRISDKFKVKRLIKLPTFPAMVTADKACKKIGVAVGEGERIFSSETEFDAAKWLNYVRIEHSFDLQ